MPWYDLAVDGVRELSRCGLFRKAKVVREPLDGIPDGSNLVFRTQYYPLTETEDAIIYNTVSGGSVSSGSYTLDYDTGTVLFTDNAAPSSQPAISYHWANLTTREFKQILLDGFDTMEAIFPRGWRVSSGSVTYAAATEDDTNIFVVSADSVADPVCGDYTFSVSKTQLAFYQCCCRIAYLDTRMISSAEDDVDYREDRGISVTRTRRTPNLERAFDKEWQKMLRYLEGVYTEHYSASDRYGQYYSSPATESYLQVHEWQYWSKMQDLRTTYRYRTGT